MKLFRFEKWQLYVSEEAWGLKPFKALLDRDKTKEKTVANAEMLFVWYYADIVSDYIVMSNQEKLTELKKDIAGLPKNWEPDEVVWNAVNYYSSFKTITEKLYEDALISAKDIGDYLRNTKALLAERDNHGKPVYDISKISSSVQRVPKLMQDLKNAYKEVVKEQKDNDNRSKGSKQFNTFEDGFTIN